MMIDYKLIDKKLNYAGLSKLDVYNYKKLKRTAQILMRGSEEQAEYIIKEICAVNPYIASECVVDTKNPGLFMDIILDDTEQSDILPICKLIVFYRFSVLQDKKSYIYDVKILEETEIDAFFKSWGEFCGFLCSIIAIADNKCDWIQDLIKGKSILFSELYQNKEESENLVTLLLNNSYYKGVFHIYEKIGASNYYLLTNNKYEDIYQIFPCEINGIQEQMNYCYINSVKREKNLFGYFHMFNPSTWCDTLCVYVSLLYEYQVTDDGDESFLNRIEDISQFDSIANRALTDPLWEKEVFENLVKSTNKCMQECRNVRVFINSFEKINYFSIDFLPENPSAIKKNKNMSNVDINVKDIFENYANRVRSMDIIDLYLNSYLKLLIKLEDAIRIVYNVVPFDDFNKYLSTNCIPAKIVSFTHSAVMVKVYLCLDSIYYIDEDLLLYNKIKKGDVIYLRFEYKNGEELSIVGVGKSKNKIREIKKECNNYLEYGKQAISIIETIENTNSLEKELDKLSLCTEIPMYYVKNCFYDFLCALEKISDNSIFLSVINCLNWNKKYQYDFLKECEDEEIVFYDKYRKIVKRIVMNQYNAGMSKADIVKIYMNSFLKYSCAPDELNVFSEDELVYFFKDYLFIGRYDDDQKWQCISVRKFCHISFDNHIESKYKALHKCLFKLTQNDDGVQLSIAVKETKKNNVPRRINRLLSAYVAIRDNIEVDRSEYKYIKMVSPEFYRNDKNTVKVIMKYTVRATINRHENCDSIRKMVNDLGEYNIYGQRFYPIKCSFFNSRTKDQYDIDKRVCLSYIRGCKKVSEAVFLFINTYVKRSVHFKDFFNMCNESDLIKDSFKESLYILLNIQITNNDVHLVPYDVAIDRLKESFDGFEEVSSGEYFAEIEIEYDGDFSRSIKSLTTLDRKRSYYNKTDKRENKRIRRLLNVYSALRKKIDVEDSEYKYIKMVSPEFYRNDKTTCRKIMRYTIDATIIRHENCDSIRGMIKKLGESNIFGQNFYPIKSDFFKSYTEKKYDIDKRVCLSYIRGCKKVSEAVFLFINTYVKHSIHFSDFFQMCNESDLIKEPFKESLYIIFKINRGDNGVHLHTDDVKIRGLKDSFDSFGDEIPSGEYYAEIEIEYDGDFSLSIKSLTTLNKKACYYNKIECDES